MLKLNISYSTRSLSSFQDVLFYVFSTLTIYSHFPQQPAHNQPNIIVLPSQIIFNPLPKIIRISALVLHGGGRDGPPQGRARQVGQLRTRVSHPPRRQGVRGGGARH